MKPKQIALLLGILLVLLLLTLLLEGPLKGRKVPEPKRLFSEFDPSLVEVIEILQNDKMARLEREGDRWVVLEVDTLESAESADKKDALRHFADTSAVKRVLNSIDSLSGDLISNNPENESLFQVTSEEGIMVKAFGKGDSLLAHFYIGKIGQDFSSTYIRRDGSNEVILARGFYRGSTFHPDVKRWRNRNILSFLPFNLNRLEITSSEENLLLQKDEEGEWTILEPIEAKTDSFKVDQLLRSLSNLNSQDFGDRATPEETGFDTPTLQISMEFLDQPSRILTIGNLKEESQYYVQASGDETIYLVNKFTIQQFQKKPEDLKANVEEKEEEKGEEEEKEG